jgi:hypothetical protein
MRIVLEICSFLKELPNHNLFVSSTRISVQFHGMHDGNMFMFLYKADRSAV